MKQEWLQEYVDELVEIMAHTLIANHLQESGAGDATDLIGCYIRCGNEANETLLKFMQEICGNRGMMHQSELLRLFDRVLIWCVHQRKLGHEVIYGMPSPNS